MSNGANPPIRNKRRQFCVGVNQEISATVPPPTGMPQNIIAPVEPRLFCELTSAAIAIRFVNAPPKPNPAPTRIANKDS